MSPNQTVCLTVDVEDFYEGMAVLGHDVARPATATSGLGRLASLLRTGHDRPRVTLFVVGNYARTVRSELSELAASGHEIASHGPDHGRLPAEAKELSEWLRRGREILEELFQTPVRGFRSPRFDVPAPVGLARFRDLIAEAGFHYVSDTHELGASSAVRELPVLQAKGFPLGGGSYQRLLPTRLVSAGVGGSARPAVLYYHSYDFGGALPSNTSIRSAAVAKQLLGRRRITKVFAEVLRRYGSEACANATD